MSNSKTVSKQEIAEFIFAKMRGSSKRDILGAAVAAGIEQSKASVLLFAWQKKQAQIALGDVENPTKEQMQEALAKAIGVKSSALGIDGRTQRAVTVETS